MIGEGNAVMMCEMDFGSSLDGIQWIEYLSDPDQGYAMSLNATVAAEYGHDYRVTPNSYLELLTTNDKFDQAGKYECRNVLAPQVRASASLKIIGEFTYLLLRNEKQTLRKPTFGLSGLPFITFHGFALLHFTSRNNKRMPLTIMSNVFRHIVGELAQHFERCSH